MLNPDDEYHNGVIEVMNEIRQIIHARRINEKKLDESIDDLLDTVKVVIQAEFKLIKKGK